MRTIRQLALVLFFLFLANFGFNQDVSFTTSVSGKKVGLSDRFYVTYTVNKAGQFQEPLFKNFTKVSGVSQGSSSNVSFINGKVKQEVSYTFRITLQPKKTGKFTVEGAKVKVGNATYESKPVSVEVVKESQVKQRRRPRSMFDQMDDMMQGFPRSQPRQPVELTDKDIFGRISVSKSSPYVNENFLVSYKLYIKRYNFGLEKYDFPTQENFWAENIKLPAESKPKIETVGGIQYQVYTLKKEILSPQKPGNLKLNPFSLTARIQTSPFSMPVSKEVKSNSPSVSVKPLPSNSPSSFVNQVGDYKITASIGSDSILVDQPIDFKLIISGKGNLKQLNNPDFDFGEEMEVYDPEIKNKISVNDGGIKGSRTYNYLLIPRKSGKYTIPSLDFTYFDLSSRTYKTKSTKSYEVKVYNEDGTLDEGNVASDESSKEETDLSKLNTVGKMKDFSWIYILIPSLLIGGITIYFLFFRKRNKEETEEERRRNARKKLAKKMAVAKSYLDSDNIEAFYDETLIGLNKYVNEKLQIQTAEMTKESIAEVLSKKQVSKTTTSKFINVLEQCEMAKYAPLSPQNNLEIYEQSIDVIEEIEEVI